MSKNIPHPDFIDAFLKHKLSEKERVVFERQLQQDPLLQNEVNLQREIVGSLAEVRKAELKARLDSIPVDGTVAWYGLGSVRWIAAAVTVASLSVATYLYFTPDDEAINQPVVSMDEHVTVHERKAMLEKPAPAEEFTSAEKAQETTVANSTNNKISDSANANAQDVSAENTTVAKKEANETENKAAKLPVIVRPDIAADFDDDFQTREYEDVEVPEKGLAQIEGVTAPNIEIENYQDAGYDFHYRYVDNKLYLYGDFKGIPYEILALNTSEKTRLFLRYDSSFYVINPSQTETVPLVAIENQALINELKIVSDHK